MKVQNYFLSIVMAAGLAACGGGGGGSSAPAQATLSGVVAKGPAGGATVSVYALVNGVKVTPALATVKTAADGSYTLSVPPQTGPVLVVADLSGADIVDETTCTSPGVGCSTYKGISGDVMQAAFVPSGTTGQTINVTPFSNMAVAAASTATGALTADNIVAASAVVRQILNNTDFLTASPTTDATMLPALTQLASQASTGDVSTIQTMLTQLSGVVTTTGSGFSVDSTNYATALCGGATCTTVADPTTIAPVTASPDLPLAAKAYALFNDLYNTLTNLHKADQTGQLDTAVASLTRAAQNAVAFVDNDQLRLIGVGPTAGTLYSNYKSGGSQFNYADPDVSCVVYNITGLDANGKFLDTSSGAAVTAANQTANAVVCNGRVHQFNGAITQSSTGNVYTNQNIFNQLVFFPQADGSMFYASRVRVSGNFTNGATTGSGSFTFGGTTAIQYGNATLTQSNTAPALSLVGKLAPSVKLFMDVPADYLAIQGNTHGTYWKSFAYSDVNLSVTANGSTDTFGNFTPTSVAFGSNGYIKLVKADNSVASSLNLVTGSITQSTVDVNVNVQAPGIKVEGVATASGANGQVSTATFTGTIYQDNGSGGYAKLLNGVVTATSTGTNSATLGFTGDVLLNNQSALRLTLSATEANGVLTANSGTFVWPNESFTITALASGGYKVSNSNGVNFAWTSGTQQADILVGDAKVGSLTSVGRVDFIDGTYLQF